MFFKDTSDKLGTPVQSIDSAVESLEDSPLTESQHPSSSSNRNSQNSNSKSSSISGAGPENAAQFGTRFVCYKLSLETVQIKFYSFQSKI